MRALLVNQGHRPWDSVDFLQKAVVDMRQHINDGVADSQ